MSSDELQEIVPKGWLKKELGEVCLKVSKIDPLDLGREVFKYVDIGSIDSASNTVASPQMLSVKDAPGRARQLIQEGDTVFSTVRPYMMNIAYIDESLDGEIASTGFCVIRPNSEFVSKGFIKFYSTSDNLLEQILPLQRGVSYPAVRDKDLFSASVLVPPLIEQQRIVEILEEQLSRLDAAMTSVNAVRKKAARFRRSLLQAGFNGELTGHDVSKGNTPNGWRTATIAEVADFIRGVTYQKSDARREPEDGFLPLLRATNIGNESLSYDEFVFVPKKVVKPEQLIRVNDMVIAASSGSISIVGKSAPVLVDFEATFGAFCAVLRPQSSISPNYFRLYVQSPICRETWSNLARGTNINNLKREQVLTTSIPVPPLVEQEKIAEILDGQISHLDVAIAVADAIEKNASAMRRSLLHAAFTGELTKQWREDAHV
jgi:type I restriction enzyme S subunit